MNPFAQAVFESLAQFAPVLGTLVLLALLVALGGFAYKSVLGDGIRWPDEGGDGDGEDDGVRRSGDDDEWKYS